MSLEKASKAAYAGDEHEFGRKLVDLADEVISAGKVHSPGALLSELLSRAGVMASTRSLGTERINPNSPAALFDAFTSNNLPGPREYFNKYFEVVASPLSRIEGDLRPGDLLVCRALGEGNLAHVSLIVTGKTLRAKELAPMGLRPESWRSGLFVEVIDVGSFPHSREDKFVRRVCDENGQLSHDRLILRISAVDQPFAEMAAFEYDVEDLAITDYSLRGIADGTLGKLPTEAFDELWSEDDPPPTVMDGNEPDEIIVTRADGARYHVRRKVRAQVLTRPDRPRAGFCWDDERVYARMTWCEGTQGTIDAGANIPGAARRLLETVVDQFNRGDGPDEIARTLENARVQTFVELAITKDRNWAFTGDFKLELSPRGIISKAAAVSFDKGPFKVGAEYRDDGAGKKVLVTVDVPLGDRTVRGKKCQERELAVWWDAECLREVPTTYAIPSPGFIEKEETMYLYFEHARDILRRNPKATTESADVVNEILKSNPKLGTALLNKRTLQRLDYHVGQGYWLESVDGYTSPEGRSGPPGKRARGADAKWEGNDELSRERAKKVRDLIEARYVRTSLRMRDLPPRMRFPAGKSMPTGVGLSELPKLVKAPGVEIEDRELDRMIIHGGVEIECSKLDRVIIRGDNKVADKRSFLEQCPKELARMTEDDRKYVTDARMSDRKRAERLFENLRRVEIHLKHREKLRGADVPGITLVHEHDCPPDVIEAAERRWGSRIPFTKPDPPLCG